MLFGDPKVSTKNFGSQRIVITGTIPVYGLGATSPTPEEAMRRCHLRSIMALIAIIGFSIWVGMEIERAREARQRPHFRGYFVPKLTGKLYFSPPMQYATSRQLLR
jgi:hypothetical protein